MEGAGRFRDIGSNSSYGAREVGAISTDSVGKYKEVLAPRQIAFIQAAAGSELSAHGYDLDPVEMSTGERLRFSAADRPYHRAVMAAWRARAAVSAQTRNTRSRLPDRRGPGMTDTGDGPVFICGAERSGTSPSCTRCSPRTRGCR